MPSAIKNVKRMIYKRNILWLLALDYLLMLGWILVLDRVINDKQYVEEQIELNLTDERIALGLIGQTNNLSQTRNSVCELEDCVSARRVAQELDLNILNLERPSMCPGIVGYERLKKFGLFKNPLPKCLIRFVVVETYKGKRRSVWSRLT